MRNLKPGVSLSRKPIADRIEAKKAQLAKLEEKIGHLCSQRVEAEEELADLCKFRDSLES